MGIKFPTPWKTLIIKFPPPRDGKGVKCPGYALGGGGHVEASIWPIHKFICCRHCRRCRCCWWWSVLANFIDEWSQCDFCFTNFGVILEYLESSIRLSSTSSRHVYAIVRDTRSRGGGPLTWKAQIHGGGHQVNFDRNLPSSCFLVEYNSLISMI